MLETRFGGGHRLSRGLHQSRAPSRPRVMGRQVLPNQPANRKRSRLQHRTPAALDAYDLASTGFDSTVAEITIETVPDSHRVQHRFASEIRVPSFPFVAACKFDTAHRALPGWTKSG